MTIQVMITPDGRLSLPANLRKRLGVAGGGVLLVEEKPDGLVLRTVAQSVAHARALARQYIGEQPEPSIDAFLDSGAPTAGSERGLSRRLRTEIDCRCGYYPHALAVSFPPK